MKEPMENDASLVITLVSSSHFMLQIECLSSEGVRERKIPT